MTINDLCSILNTRWFHLSRYLSPTTLPDASKVMYATTQITKHALRGRKKKELLTARFKEFGEETTVEGPSGNRGADWKVEAHPALVAVWEEMITGPGP